MSAGVWVVHQGSPAKANQSPLPPVIIEPQTDGQIVNPADVHMETGPFSDPDPGDAHLCTDWEIWTIAPAERVWKALCIGGVQKVHTHLGDGVFEGSHAGFSTLLFEMQYRLQVRHSDDSGHPPTEWSPWSERFFETGPPTSVFPLELDDILASPPPQWLAGGSPVVLAAAGTPASLRIETTTGEPLLEIEGNDGTTNTITNSPPASAHNPVRVIVAGGDSGLTLEESDLSFVNDEAEQVTIYLPLVNLAPGEAAHFWVSATGATYVGEAGQTEPDFSQLARGAPTPWTVDQPGYVVEVVASGFRLPVNIAFVPNAGSDPLDPSYYVTELYGTIKVVTGNGTIGDYATNLLNYSPTGVFPGSGEMGLAGIAVDPASGDVFAGMMYNAGGPFYPKVVRFQSTDGGLTAATQTTILDMVGEEQGPSHQVSNITIGPDGKLYVHMGDGFFTATALNLDSFRGKILRMNLDGTAASDNPFYDAANGINARDYVYAYGVRNPFGGAWRESDGFHYEVENGPSTDRFAKVNPGQNFLWDGTDASMQNGALHNWNPATAPVNLAFIQPGTFGGSGFPAEKLGRAFVSQSGATWSSGPQFFGSKRIQEYVLDAGGALAQGPIDFLTYNGTGKGTAVALAAGPDGLYFSDFYKDLDFAGPTDVGAKILRAKFAGVADFTADVTEGPAPLAVQFTDLSNVPSPSEWLWDFGDCTTSAEQNPMHVYEQDGIYDVQLRVTGAGGLRIAQKDAFILVGDITRVALIGGSQPTSAADNAIANRLSGQGLLVEVFDDEPANRPPASELAVDYDVVLISATVDAANIGGEFLPAAVPIVYWEPQLNAVGFMPLARFGASVAGADAIEVTNNAHPITSGLPLGAVTVFSPADTMSVGRNNLGAGVSVLATRSGAAGDYAVMAVETGGELFGGSTAAARRAFVFLSEAAWFSATAAAQQIFDQAVYWALDQAPASDVFGDFDGDGEVDENDMPLFVAELMNPSPAVGCEDAPADINLDGAVNGGDIAAYTICLLNAGCP